MDATEHDMDNTTTRQNLTRSLDHLAGYGEIEAARIGRTSPVTGTRFQIRIGGSWDWQTKGVQDLDVALGIFAERDIPVRGL